MFDTPSTLPWAVEIPEGLRPVAYAEAATFHPAFLYEALWSLATVGVLLALERRGILGRGRLLFGYLVAYGTGRFALELIRTNTPFRLIGGTVALLAGRTRHLPPTPEPTAPLVGADSR